MSEHLSAFDMDEHTNEKFIRVRKRVMEKTGAVNFHASWGPKAVHMTEDELFKVAMETLTSKSEPVAIFERGKEPWYKDQEARDFFTKPDPVDVREWVESLDKPPVSGLEKSKL